MISRRNVKKYLTLFGVVVLFFYYVFASQTNRPSVKDAKTPVAEVAGTNTDAQPSTPVYFTAPTRPYDDRKVGGIENNLIALIDNAKTSVDLAVFEFDLEDVAQALIRAKERGVQVRVVHDNEHTKSDPQIGELEAVGIPAVADNRSAFMHDKFFVIDRKCVWTGSFNITVNAAFKNNENAVVICSDDVAENYGVEFQEMFEGKFGAKSPANTPHPITELDGVKIENYFAPEDEVMAKIIDTVAKSEKSVHFMAFSFTDDDLADKMVLLLKKGVEVSGIFETQGADTAASECKTLVENQAKIGLDGNPYTFHHKVIIVDGKAVIFGSFNFTANADNQNDENLLIIHSEKLAAQFEQEFQRRFAESTPPQAGKCARE